MKIQIYNEDCLLGMQRIPDKSVDMILCDLPYGTTACKWDNLIDLNKLWTEYNRIIKDNGAIVLFGSQPFSTDLINSNRKHYRYEWIWEKNNATGFQNANKMPMKKHENILVFYKKLPTYNPQGLIPYNKPNRRGSVGENWNMDVQNSYIQQFTNYPTSILKFGYDKEKYHSTQKPVPLLEYLIKTYTDENQTVLDNTMGSGSTIIACLNTNRNFIGFELDENYFNIAKERIENHAKEK